MEESRLRYLFNQYFNGLISKEQEDEFLTLVSLLDSTSELEQIMEHRWSTFTSDQYPFDLHAKNRMLNSIFVAEEQQHTQRPMVLWQRIGIAAALIIISGIALLNYSRDSQKEIVKQVVVNDPIIPGFNKAVLVLANGKRISLTDAKNGQIASLSGITITKLKDGTVVYNIADQENSTPVEEFNTIETPKGGQYKINLPDGTSVALNAASTLKFPTSFAKLSQRRVELVGEGYFEVAKNKTKPFIVETATQEVEVLGTHFNINAYTDEHVVKTTLLEGLVKVNKSVLIKPGQQAVLNNGHININAVDTESEIAWKNGRFSFTSRDFKSIMRTISRWYNVDIVYEYEPANLHLSGGISRFKDINDVLGLLQETGDVKFKVEGRRIAVIK